MDRIAEQGELRACYEASGAGYVLQRAMRERGHQCEVIAPSLIPTKPGVQRKHNKHDAAQLALLYRAGDLTIVRIPSEAEERVRDVVRCRGTFQRELLKSPHYTKVPRTPRLRLSRGNKLEPAHLRWLRQLTRGTSSLALSFSAARPSSASGGNSRSAFVLDAIGLKSGHALLTHELERKSPVREKRDLAIHGYRDRECFGCSRYLDGGVMTTTFADLLLGSDIRWWVKEHATS